jgi:hypothetical protein
MGRSRWSPSAADAIDSAVKAVESRLDDATSPPTRYGDDQPFVWFELTEALVDGGTAEAHPVRWRANGAGSYAADTTVTRIVRDTVGGHATASGKRVFCRPMPAETGTVWEVVRNC